MLHSVQPVGSIAGVAAATDQRHGEPQASPACSSSSMVVLALAGELEALKAKAAKVIAYGRHRAGQYERALLQYSTSAGAEQALLQCPQGGSSGRDGDRAGAASKEAAVAGFRGFWASVEKQLARLLVACHKAAAAAATAAAAAASGEAVGAVLSVPAWQRENASLAHLLPPSAPAGPVIAASRAPVNVVRRTPPRTSHVVMQVGLHMGCRVRGGADGLLYMGFAVGWPHSGLL